MQDSKHNVMADSYQEQVSSRGAKVFKRVMMATGILILIVIIGLTLSVNYASVENIDQFLLHARPWLGAWRLLVFLLVFGFWPNLSVLYAGWSGMSTEQLERMLAYRWRMAVWVLLMEAVFSQKILDQFINQLFNSGGLL